MGKTKRTAPVNSDDEASGAKRVKSLGAKGQGFRDKKKVKLGVLDYVFAPARSTGFRFDQLQVLKTWPAKQVKIEKLRPFGSPTYEPGQHVHYQLLTAANQFVRFAHESFFAIVALLLNVVVAPVVVAPPAIPAGADAAAIQAAMVAAAQAGADAALAQAAAAAPPETEQLRPLSGDAAHRFLMESAAGCPLNLVDRIEIMVENNVVKTIELTGGALARYHALANRCAKERHGPDAKSMPTAFWMPLVDSDLAPIAANASEMTQRHARHVRRIENGRYLTKSSIYGFPFGYDPVVAGLHDLKDGTEMYFGPGTHIDIRVYLRDNFSVALRSLEADTPGLTDQQRRALWARGQRVMIEQMWFEVETLTFNTGSPFLRDMEAEFARTNERKYPCTNATEWRAPVHQGLTEQELTVNLYGLSFPVMLYLCFMKTTHVDGRDGHNQNTSVYKFPENLASFDVLYNNQSLLPGGEVTKLNEPGADTMDKHVFYRSQVPFRRSPGTYDEFYTSGVQQFAAVPLDTLYFQDNAKFTELQNLLVRLKWSNERAPAGYQLVVTAVCENVVVLHHRGRTHSVLNATGAKIVDG